VRQGTFANTGPANGDQVRGKLRFSAKWRIGSVTTCESANPMPFPRITRRAAGKVGIKAAATIGTTHTSASMGASILLVKEFAAQHDERPGGRVVLMTSGQHLAPMAREVAYAISKGALHQATKTLADELIDRASP
jgi:NAD(P)-dependent dehydrogenase (short-subunit alcohol dehydrogenase family)